MTTITDYLDELRDIDHDGPEAPWAIKSEGAIVSTALEGDPIVTDGVEYPEDAELIIAARNAMPRLLNAVEAAMEHHKPWPGGVGRSTCGECGTSWPCSTATEVAEALGVQP